MATNSRSVTPSSPRSRSTTTRLSCSIRVAPVAIVTAIEPVSALLCGMISNVAVVIAVTRHRTVHDSRIVKELWCTWRKHRVHRLSRRGCVVTRHWIAVPVWRWDIRRILLGLTRRMRNGSLTAIGALRRLHRRRWMYRRLVRRRRPHIRWAIHHMRRRRRRRRR